MVSQAQSAYGFSDWLAAEREALDSKHEYEAGQVYAMTGASFNHNLIVSNLIGELRNRLRAQPCAVLGTDMRVRIQAADAAKYPDVLVVCGAPQFHDDRRDVLLNPTLIIEVLSPSTEAYDRGGKFAVYRQLPSLAEYALVAQDPVSVELYTRQPDGSWLYRFHGDLEDRVTLTSLDCVLPVRDIYGRVGEAS